MIPEVSIQASSLVQLLLVPLQLRQKAGVWLNHVTSRLHLLWTKGTAGGELHGVLCSPVIPKSASAVWKAISHLNGVRQRQLPVLHQVGDADAGGATTTILAVDHRAAPAGCLQVDGVGAAVEMAVEVLVGVVVHRNLQPLDGGGGKRLLLGYVDAERHCLLLDELVAAGRSSVADEQALGHLTEL